MADEAARRRVLLTAALGFRLLNLNDPAARALAAWMAGPAGWAATFLQKRPLGGAVEVVCSVHGQTP